MSNFLNAVLSLLLACYVTVGKRFKVCLIPFSVKTKLIVEAMLQLAFYLVCFNCCSWNAEPGIVLTALKPFGFPRPISALMKRERSFYPKGCC